MNWSLRPAVAGDTEGIAGVDAAASQYPWPETQFCLALAVDAANLSAFVQYILLAECDGLVCGFVVYSKVLDEAEILNIAVHPAYQGRGMARNLVLQVIQQLKNEAVERCLLEVRASNTTARGLYDSLGFKPDGVRKNYYRAGDGREDAVLMSKSLLEPSEKRVPL